MSLYIHTFVDKHDKPLDEVGMCFGREEALQWLDDYLHGFERAGCAYECTRVIVDPMATTSVQYRIDMIQDLEEWTAEARNLGEHERIEREKVRQL